MQVTSVRDIASLIRVRRKELGWTQAQLAERAGVSRDWIIGLEKAKPSVELTLVLRTLKALSVKLSSEQQSAHTSKQASAITALIQPPSTNNRG